MFNARTFLLLFTILILILNSFVNSLCMGKYQSQSLASDQLRDIYLIGINRFSERFSAVTWENNGETVVLTYTIDTKKPTINSGPFEDETYRLEFMYYHWLDATDSGQDGDPMEFPAELHVVFVNKRYANYQEASRKNLAIAIATFKHMVVEDDTMNSLDLLYEPIDNIYTPYSKVEVAASKTPYLFDFVNIERVYYMYVGKSVFGTSSVCSGDVIWFEFDIPLEIKRKQVESFRKLMSYDEVPLMSKIKQFTPPNSTIYQSVSPFLYLEQTNSTAKLFEGFDFVFDSAPVSIAVEKILLLLVLIFNHIAY